MGCFPPGRMLKHRLCVLLKLVTAALVSKQENVFRRRVVVVVGGWGVVEILSFIG